MMSKAASRWAGRERIEQIGSVLPALCVGLAATLALRRLDDFDTWWHLASGRWIAHHRAVPHTDTLSFTVRDHAWTNLQWLYDLALYGLYQVGGADLLVVSTALAFSLAIALVVANLRLALGPVGAAAIGVWVTLIAQERFTVRPEMVSFICLESVLWLYATAHRDQGRRLWVLPFLMVLWVNTHALFIVGVFIIGAHMASVVAARLPVLPAGWQPPRSRAATRPSGRVLLSGAVAVLVTLVNPYFVRGALFPFELLSRIDGSDPVFQMIGEFHPPFSAQWPDLPVRAYQVFFVFSIVLVAVASLLAALPGRKGGRAAARRRARRTAAAQAEPAPDQQGGRFDLADLIVFCGLAYLSLLARRNMALFAMGAAPFVGQCLLILRSRLPGALPAIWTTGARTVGAIAPPVLIAAAWFVVSNGFYRWNASTVEFGTGVLEVNFPIRASAFVRQMKLPGRLYNDLTAGGYLAWDRPTGDGVYVDGRLEVYDPAFLSQYWAGLSDPGRWQTEADRAGVRTVLLFHRWDNRRQLIRWLLSDPRWALVYFDEVAIVFVRQAENQALIESARQRFATWNEDTVNNLAAPAASWQWPVARTQELWNYARLLDTIGRADESVEFYARLLDLRPAPELELEARVALAAYYARKGEIDTARMHLARAADLDPTDQRVSGLRRHVGR